MSGQGQPKAAANSRFRTSEPETVWQISSKCFPELLHLTLLNEVQLVVVLLIFRIVSVNICLVRPLSVSMGRASATATAAATLLESADSIPVRIISIPCFHHVYPFSK